MSLVTASRYLAACAAAALVAQTAFAAESTGRTGRQIEEMVVTAEKRESTVSDTSIAITAFDASKIADLGLKGADDLINFIPATTRDAYDIRIRGVGRNFRALGGDPGVATYYNGVYSEDFGIASTENALYDVERVEVLRGPQGTLYGRNSIGGALNYINKGSTPEWSGEARVVGGNFNANEYYGAVSGPLIEDVLGFRLTGVKRYRAGAQRGIENGENIGDINDKNIAVAFDLKINDQMDVVVRANDRRSERIIPSGVLLDMGRPGERGRDFADGSFYTNGLRIVTDPATPGVVSYRHPVTGATILGARVRPGIDRSNSFPYAPQPHFGAGPTTPLFQGKTDGDDVKSIAATNGLNDERFDHNAVSLNYTYNITDAVTFKYIGGYSDFTYTFDVDNNNSAKTLSNYRQTVREDVYTYSHEFQVLWDYEDWLNVTHGAYKFYSDRFQHYSLNDLDAQGRYVRPANYGALAGILGRPVQVGDAPMFRSISGDWGGSPTGDIYRHRNVVTAEAYALFTQADIRLNNEWMLTLGGRWAQDEKTAREVRGGYFETSFGLGLATENILMGNATSVNGVFTPRCALADPNCQTPLRLQGVPLSYTSTTSGDHTWSDVNYRVNMNWTPNDDILVYLGATTGYRAGGYSLGVSDARDVLGGAVGEPFSYKEERVIAYELGYKGTHFDKQLQVYAAIYQYNYDNYQDQTNSFDPVRARGVDTVTNAPEAVNQGFEVEFTWLATDSATIGGNYSYTDATYSKTFILLDFENPATPPSILGSPAVAANFPIYARDAKGNQLKRIPEHKATVFGSYDWDTSIGRFTANGSVAWVGEFYSDAVQNDNALTPDRWRTDAGLIYSTMEDKLRVRAFVENIFDNKIREVGSSGEASNWSQNGSYLYPRYYGVDARYTF